MSAEVYKKVISPVLDRFDSEKMKTRAENALHFAEISPMTLKILELFADQHRRFKDDRLKVVLGKVELENPVMVAAGWDKQGRVVKALYTLGFSGVEVGTVPFYPQSGNPKPRQFLIGPGVALNWLGFNSPGAEKVDKNLESYFGSKIPIGISIGKNKDIPDKVAPEMHALVVKRLYKYASYFVINVSSPNTPGLRRLQGKEPLTDIAQAVKGAIKETGKEIDIYVKVAPDLSREATSDVLEVVIDNGLRGMVSGNTTVNPEIKAKYGERWRDQQGGLSGDDPEYRKMTAEQIAHIYKDAGGKIEIIGVGGVKDATTALEKIKAGAKVVQVLTAIRGEGPSVAGRINRGIVRYMEKEGVRNVNELVGLNVK